MFNTIILVHLHFSLNAQGYRGEVLVGGIVGLSHDFGTMGTVQTTHGVVFDGGSFVGAGIAVSTNLAGKLEFPIYGKFTQSFNLSYHLQSIVGLSVGFCMDQNTSYGLYLAPEIGVQVGRIKFFLNYSYRNLLNNSTDHGGGVITYDTSKAHCIGAGIGLALGRK